MPEPLRMQSARQQAATLVAASWCSLLSYIGTLPRIEVLGSLNANLCFFFHGPCLFNHNLTESSISRPPQELYFQSRIFRRLKEIKHNLAETPRINHTLAKK
jgi:hypothetical protein